MRRLPGNLRWGIGIVALLVVLFSVVLWSAPRLTAGFASLP